GEAAPKPKASVRRTRSSSDTSITPSTAAASPGPTASVKGKQAAKASKAKRRSALSEVAMTEAQQLKLVLKRSMQQMHISQPSGSGVDEGTGSKPGVLDVPTDESEEELSWNSTDDEGDDNEGKDDESDEEDEDNDGEEGNGDDEDDDGDKDDDDDADQEVVRDDDKDDNEEDESDGEEDLGLNIGEEERHDEEEEEEEDELYRDVHINQGRGLQGTLEVEDIHVTLTQSVRLHEEAQRENDEFLRTVDENIKKIIKEQVKEQVKAQVSKILPRIKQAVNEQLEAKVLTKSSHSSRTSYAVAADLSETELKNILIEKMEGNKSIQHSDEQRNLYKALVDAYESDKNILDTYGETITLKRRRDDDEEPFARLDQGLPFRWNAHPEFDTGADDQPIIQSSQHPKWFSQPQKPPSLDRDWNKTLPAVHESIQPWINKLAKQADTRSSFNELMDTPLDFSNFIMNRLRVDTLTPKLLAGPTFDLMKGSCKSLIELEYYLEEVYKAITDQLDWVNPEGQQYPHNLLQPSPLIPDKRGRRVIPFAHFINNDLEYRRGDMLLLLVQGRLTNLTVEEHFAFNVSLRMFTRSIVIQRRVEDLQLGVESYQKRLNLTKPDTYRSDLKRKEAYTAYSNPRGFIYQNKEKKNILMRIDELYKFSDGTLIDVRTALDDSLKGIRMQYL
nr:hypothetical protein [Tanacetum cinerariifolium]